MAAPSSKLTCFAFRLRPGQDLRKEILRFAKQNKIKAGCVITCVGSATQIHVRLANQDRGILKKGFFEIISLVGTFSASTAHLHIAFANKKGIIIGGHLLEDNIVFTTAELVVGSLPQFEFTRADDPETGYQELKVRGQKNQKIIS